MSQITRFRLKLYQAVFKTLVKYTHIKTWRCGSLASNCWRKKDIIMSKLATYVQQCFPTTMEVPSQVKLVLELSFNHLSSVFGNWNEYFQYLYGWIFNAADYTCAPKGGINLILTNGDLTRAQLLEWRRKFYNQLLSFAKDHVGKQRDSLIGGVGNHKDVFLPLYGNIFELYVFSKCVLRMSTDSNENKSLVSDMVELEEALKPFLRNPLVSNIFRIVFRLHDKSVDAWESFGPYFPLR